MVHAEFFDDVIYSISLSKRSHFTSLLIKENHQKRFHSGVFHTLAQLRNEHWIPQGRSEVEKSDQFMATVSVNDFKADKLPSASSWPMKEDAKSAPLTFLTPCTSNSGENVKKGLGISLHLCHSQSHPFGTDKGYHC